MQGSFSGVGRKAVKQSTVEGSYLFVLPRLFLAPLGSPVSNVSPTRIGQPLGWQPAMGSESRADSAKSRRSNLTTDIVERGPIMVNGVLFQKIRRCPLCLKTNADPNPIKSGPRAESAFNVWAAGSESMPSGRLDRICSNVFTEGGFAEEYNGDIDAFMQKRKAEAQVMQEWNTAYKTFVELIENTELGHACRVDASVPLVTCGPDCFQF